MNIANHMTVTDNNPDTILGLVVLLAAALIIYIIVCIRLSKKRTQLTGKIDQILEGANESDKEDM